MEPNKNNTFIALTDEYVLEFLNKTHLRTTAIAANWFKNAFPPEYSDKNGIDFDKIDLRTLRLEKGYHSDCPNPKTCTHCPPTDSFIFSVKAD